MSGKRQLAKLLNYENLPIKFVLKLRFNLDVISRKTKLILNLGTQNPNQTFFTSHIRKTVRQVSFRQIHFGTALWKGEGGSSK